MSDLYVSEAFNLFVGDAGPDNTKHLIIKNLKLPEMEELTAQHHAGGSWGALDIGGLGMKELMCSFKLTGWDPQTIEQFGINGRVKYPYTAYANVRSKATGAATMVMAKMWGRITKMARPEMKRGDLLEVDHEIKEITHYEEYFGSQEMFYWDWQTSLWRVQGKVQNQDEITNLSIPAASASASPGSTGT